jgi:hypothetical protein
MTGLLGPNGRSRLLTYLELSDWYGRPVYFAFSKDVDAGLVTASFMCRLTMVSGTS